DVAVRTEVVTQHGTEKVELRHTPAVAEFPEGRLIDRDREWIEIGVREHVCGSTTRTRGGSVCRLAAAGWSSNPETRESDPAAGRAPQASARTVGPSAARI